ncbi:MAG: hypothetical protein JSR28_04705 [Proteobacteria bacterium]|nr:hypothetical protein [Pseudomonadota bacterium]
MSIVMKMLHGTQAAPSVSSPLDPAVGFCGCKHSGNGWKGRKMQIDGFLYGKAVYLRAG